MENSLYKCVLCESPQYLGSKDFVKVYKYDKIKYYVKGFNEDLDKKRFLEVLFSFELFKSLGFNIPELSVCLDGDELLIFSKECQGDKLCENTLQNSWTQRKELTKIIYAADILGFGDIANDNIIVDSNNKLTLIDFEPINSNPMFPPLNVYGSEYYLKRSYDFHNTKGNMQAVAKLIENLVDYSQEPDSSLISKDDKEKIENNFLNLNFYDITSRVVLCCEKGGIKVNESDIQFIVDEYSKRQNYLKDSKEKCKGSASYNEDPQESGSTAPIVEPVMK